MSNWNWNQKAGEKDEKKMLQKSYIYPKSSQIIKKKKKKILGNLEHFAGAFFSLISPKSSPKHTQINHYFSYLQKSKGSVLASISSSLVHLPWFWGLRGVNVAF